MAAAPAMGTFVNLRLVLLCLGLALVAAPTHAASYMLVVSGLGGEEGYEQRFTEWADTVVTAGETLAGDPARVLRFTGKAATAAAIEQAMGQLATRLHADDQLCIVLIGHGSYDGSEYRMNLPGNDITGSTFAALLDKLPATTPVLLINATSASGAVADRWLKPNRVVITATRSAGERNATRFAGYWAEALTSSEADRNKDETVTAEEAYEYASRKVADAFKSDAAMATEHPRIGGREPGRFIVARLGKAARHANDAQLLTLREQQTGIERELADVKARKTALQMDAYYQQLEPVLLRLARLGQQIDAREAQLDSTAAGKKP
ncbi:MAG: hypothetical protein ABI859_09225 [Pseudomonadota bacterium]